MIRKGTLFCLLIAVVGGSAMFVIAHHAKEREQEIDRLRHAVKETRAAITVLEAEWAYLNRLDRLQRLSSEYLGLGPVPPERVLTISDLPVRPEPAAPPAPIGVAARNAGERVR